MKKNIYFEVLRIIAIIFVIFNHTGTTGFQLYAITDNAVMYYFYMVCAILCKVAVPIFFMISGALLLNKEESVKTVYTKRILRIIIALSLFSLLVYTLNIKDNLSSFDLTYFLRTLYSSSLRSSYWYLYAYISFLIALPLLRKMVKTMEKKDFVYLLLMGIFAYYIIPIFQNILGIGRNSYLDFVFAGKVFLFYPLIGYYCDKHLCLNRKSLSLLISGSVLSIILTIIMTNSWIDQTGNVLSQNWLNAFILIPSMTVFSLVKYLFEKINVDDKVGRVLCTIGSCTFGIYLLEGPIRQNIYEPVFYAIMPYLKVFPACLVTVMAVFFVGLVIVYLLRKIPLLNKIL